MLSPARATDPDTFSPVVSYQYLDSLAEPGTPTTITSPVVSYQYLDSLAEPGTSTTITSPVVSYQYFDWPGDENLTFQNSPRVSYYFYSIAPVITQQPQNQWAKVGTNATLSVQAGGAAPLSYQWRRSGVNLANTNNAALVLNNVQSVQAGTYSVVITNAYGQVASIGAKLTVYGGPLTAKPDALPLNATGQPLAGSLANKRTTPVSSQLKWFDPNTGQFAAVPLPFPSNRKTVVITHGWRDGVESERQDELTSANHDQGWIKTMALALHAQTYPGGIINVLAWDWGPAAKISDDPAVVSVSIVPQGTALGAALMDLLGPSYSQPIHFIGHSFGCGVNCKAADYIHGNWRPGGDVRSRMPSFDFNKTHMTLLDEAEVAAGVKGMHVLGDAIVGLWDKTAINDEVEQIQDFYIKVIPDHYRWIDNYVSEVALPHSVAANVMLFRKNYFKDVFAPHGYACVWYTKTIQQLASSPPPLMGHRYSFERNSLDDAPLPPTYYVQSVARDSAETELIKTNLGLAVAVNVDRFLLYPTEKAAEAMTAAKDQSARLLEATEDAAARGWTATGNAVQAAKTSIVNFAGTLWNGVVEAFSAPQGEAIIITGPGAADPMIAPVQVQGSSLTMQAWWDMQYKLSASGSPAAQLKAPPALVVTSASTPLTGDITHAAFMTLASHVPLEAVGVTFEYQVTGAAPDDFITMGIGTDSYFSLEARYVGDGVWSSSPMFQVSDLRAQDVELTFAFLGSSGPPSGTLSIRNIQFYIPPRPKLELEATGPQLTVSWPVSAVDWTLESTVDLANPNGWQPVNVAPVDADYFHTQTFDIAPTNKAFFRLRK